MQFHNLLSKVANTPAYNTVYFPMIIESHFMALYYLLAMARVSNPLNLIQQYVDLCTTDFIDRDNTVVRHFGAFIENARSGRKLADIYNTEYVMQIVKGIRSERVEIEGLEIDITGYPILEGYEPYQKAAKQLWDQVAQKGTSYSLRDFKRDITDLATRRPEVATLWKRIGSEVERYISTPFGQRDRDHVLILDILADQYSPDRNAEYPAK